MNSLINRFSVLKIPFMKSIMEFYLNKVNTIIYNYFIAATIVDIDSYKQPVNGAWLNGHAILDVRTGSSNILWAQSSVIATSESPKFNAVTPVFSSKPGFICFTLSYIDQETVLVDCADTSKDILSNYFYIVYKNVLQTPIQLPNSNLQNLKSATTGKRLM